LLYGEPSTGAGRWVHRIAEDLRAGKVQEVIARLQRMRPQTPELRDKLQGLIAGCLTVLGIAAWDHAVSFGREQALTNGDFQLGQAGMSARRKILPESGGG